MRISKKLEDRRRRRRRLLVQLSLGVKMIVYRVKDGLFQLSLGMKMLIYWIYRGKSSHGPQVTTESGSCGENELCMFEDGRMREDDEDVLTNAHWE